MMCYSICAHYIRRISIAKLIYMSFGTIIFLDAMDAYAIFSIPFPWIAKFLVLMTFSGMILFCRNDLTVKLPQKILIYAVIWSLFITLFNNITVDYEGLLPSGTTTSYSVYVALRFINILSFLAFSMLIYYLLSKSYLNKMIKFLVYAGMCIALFGLYTYWMQSYDLWEPLRTRIGTSGAEQSIIFTDVDPTKIYKRALGSFREPGLLAAWLLVPFYFSFSQNTFLFWMARFLIGITILFTLSVGGILAIVLSVFFVSLLMIIRMVKKRDLHLNYNFKKLVLRICIAIMLACAAIGILKSDSAERLGIHTQGLQSAFENILLMRIQNIIFNGLSHSNRDYIYDYLKNSNISWTGQGLGNANIIFNQYLLEKYSSDFFGEYSYHMPPSILSLYLNLYYSVGIWNSLLYLLVLFIPICILLKNVLNQQKLDTLNVIVFLSYLSWLIIFLIQAEEFTLMFAVPFAFALRPIIHPLESKFSYIKRF